MTLPSIFDQASANQVIARINQLSTETKPVWGKMDVARMLAHCNVTYEMVYTDKHKKPNAFMRWILGMFVKNGVINEKPYPKNSQTATVFIISDEREFEKEKQRLIDYIQKTQGLGASYFEGKESLSFGKLSAPEWSNLFYKHLDHHLRQFGV
jgi:hypothetical protein